MTTQDTTQASTVQEYTIDLVSRDAAGQITEHIRIHPNGREEKIDLGKKSFTFEKPTTTSPI